MGKKDEKQSNHRGRKLLIKLIVVALVIGGIGYGIHKVMATTDAAGGKAAPYVQRGKDLFEQGKDRASSLVDKVHKHQQQQ